MTDIDVTHYSYRVFWSAEDGEFVGTCAEYSLLSWLAPTQQEALDGIQAVVRETVQDLVEEGRPVPEPFADRRFSGVFNLRVGSELHRQLAVQAAEHGVSLNQWANQKLAS